MKIPATIHTLAILNHIKKHYGTRPVSAPEMAERTGMCRTNLHNRLKRYASGGWLKATQASEFRAKYKQRFNFTAFELTPMGLQLLADNQRRADEFRALTSKKREYVSPLSKSGVSTCFSGMTSIFSQSP